MTDPQPPLNLLDLLTHIGLPHIRVQSLIESITNARTRKRGDTLVTFGTTQITANDILRGCFPMTGFIVWVPTLRVVEAMRQREPPAVDVSRGC